MSAAVWIIIIIILIILVVTFVLLFVFVWKKPSPKPEVFLAGSSTVPAADLTAAQTICNKYDAIVATPEQMTASQTSGSQYCEFGWTSDGKVGYPMQVNNSCCGAQIGVISNNPGTGSYYAVNCYGIKPPSGTTDIADFCTPQLAFNTCSCPGGCSSTQCSNGNSTWSQYN